MRTGSIYLIINKENGHKYVGQTTQGINKRWKQHIQESMRMSDKPLHCAMRKYGNHVFSIKQIDECDESLLDEREKYWIERYNTFNSSEGYNATSGGNRPTFSIKTKEKISQTKTGVQLSKKHIENIKTTLTEKKKNWGFHLAKNRGSGITSRIEMLGINIETGEEKTWESAKSAAEEVAGDPKYAHNILTAADKGWKAYGYRWRRIGNKSNKRKVYGVHRKTWDKTPVYESIRDAIRNHTDNSRGTGLSKSLKHPNKYTWKGYYWFYV